MRNSYDDGVTPTEQLTNALTEWQNEPSLADLKQDYTEATSSHDEQVTRIDTWLDNLHVRGKAKPKPKKGFSGSQPKLIRKQAEWRYAALSEPFLSADDIFSCSPVSPGDKEAAIQNTIILNNQFNTQLDKVRLIDESVRTAVDEGTLIYRVGWDYEYETRMTGVPLIQLTPTDDPNVMEQHEQIHEMMDSAPDDYNQLPPELIQAHEAMMEDGVAYVGEIIGYEEEEEIHVIKNQPTVEVCDYRDITIDPTAKSNPDKAEFIIYEFETSKSELSKSGVNYQNIENIKTSQASPLAHSDGREHHSVNFNFKDDARKKFVAYEYWGFYDIDNSGVTTPIVATWVGDTLIRMEENPFPDKKLPFVFVPYLLVRGSVYGEPDGELLIDNQKIVGAITRGMIDLMGRSANGQMGFRTDALDLVNQRKYDNGQDYNFNPNVDPRNAIITHTYPEIPQSASYMLDMNNSEAESLTGVRAFNSNSSRGLGDTATEARGALDAASKRELGILRRLAEGVKQVGRKIIAMNAEFLSDTEVVRVTNDKFVEIRRDDLSGKFDLRLSISTAESDNEKASELSFMLQTMGNNQDAEITRMLQADIARLRKMPDLAKRLEEYSPEPDPFRVKQQELEIALLEAKVFNEQAKGQENAVDVELKKAKTQTEQSKSRSLDSGSDKVDLDFLQEESGTKHQQALEKQDLDRNAKLDLKAVESMLTPRAE